MGNFPLTHGGLHSSLLLSMWQTSDALMGKGIPSLPAWEAARSLGRLFSLCVSVEGGCVSRERGRGCVCEWERERERAGCVMCTCVLVFQNQALKPLILLYVHWYLNQAHKLGIHVLHFRELRTSTAIHKKHVYVYTGILQPGIETRHGVYLKPGTQTRHTALCVYWNTEKLVTRLLHVPVASFLIHSPGRSWLTNERFSSHCQTLDSIHDYCCHTSDALLTVKESPLSHPDIFQSHFDHPPL